MRIAVQKRRREGIAGADGVHHVHLEAGNLAVHTILEYGATTLAELKRPPSVLVEYLFRENNFPAGAYLMTGTGIVPPDSFTLLSGDRIRITIDPIGTLENVVVQGPLTVAG